MGPAAAPAMTRPARSDDGESPAAKSARPAARRTMVERSRTRGTQPGHERRAQQPPARESDPVEAGPRSGHRRRRPSPLRQQRERPRADTQLQPRVADEEQYAESRRGQAERLRDRRRRLFERVAPFVRPRLRPCAPGSGERERQRHLRDTHRDVAHLPRPSRREHGGHDRGTGRRSDAPARVEHVEETRAVPHRGVRVDAGVDPARSEPSDESQRHHRPPGRAGRVSQQAEAGRGAAERQQAAEAEGAHRSAAREARRHEAGGERGQERAHGAEGHAERRAHRRPGHAQQTVRQTQPTNAIPASAASATSCLRTLLPHDVAATLGADIPEVQPRLVGVVAAAP